MGFPSIPQQRAAPGRIGDAFVEGLDRNLVGVLPGHQHLRRWQGQAARGAARARAFFHGEKWGNHGENAWEPAGNLGKIPGR